jgi:hypothetical protein
MVGFPLGLSSLFDTSADSSRPGQTPTQEANSWGLRKVGSPQELVNPGVFVGVLQNMGLEEGGLCTRTGD